MERFRISSVAKSLGVSTTTIYKHLKRLQTRFKVQTIQEAGVTYLTSEGVALLQEAIAAAHEITTLVEAVPQVPAHPNSEIARQLEEIRAALLALANENRTLKEEVSTLREKVAATDPAEGFRRFYASFFSPAPRVLETCRDRYYHEPLMLSGPDNIVPLFAGKN